VISESKRAEEERRRLELEEEEQLRKVLEMSRLEAEEKEVIKRMEYKAEENEIRQSQLAKEAKVEKAEEVIPKEQPKPVVGHEPMILPPVRRRKKVEESPKVEKVEEPPKVEVVQPHVEPVVVPPPPVV
jgi:hypothetical protein